MSEVIGFPGKPIRKVLPVKEVHQISFMTMDNRRLYIDDEAFIMKIMQFIIKEKIKIIEA